MEEKYRIILFISLCLPARLLLAYIGKLLEVNINKKTKNNIWNLLFYLLTLIIGISFINNWIANNKIGFFKGKAWWYNLRLVHGINFIIYSILSLLKIRNTYKILVMDAFIGLLSFIIHYFI